MDENGGGGEGSAESNTEGILQEGILYYKRVYYITRGYTILQECILYYKSVYYITRGYTTENTSTNQTLESDIEKDQERD